MGVAHIRNESNLIQRPAGRPTLAQMKARLASSRPEAAVVPKRATFRKTKNHPWIWASTICGLLVSANFLMYIQKEQLMDLLGFQRVLVPLAAPPTLNTSGQALFWAYAAYAPDQLIVRYHTSVDDLIDPDNAKHHLTALMKLAIDSDTRAKIMALEKHQRRERI